MCCSASAQLEDFRWFGPDSLIPSLPDLYDAIGMFKWFFGFAPKPQLDRWTYWEKFDYWAPSWGVTIIGVSGAMLWFKELTATYLPGWVFNVATIFTAKKRCWPPASCSPSTSSTITGRPDKFPLDIVMFTGVVPLEEFSGNIRSNTIAWSRAENCRNTWLTRRRSP